MMASTRSEMSQSLQDRMYLFTRVKMFLDSTIMSVVYLIEINLVSVSKETWKGQSYQPSYSAISLTRTTATSSPSAL